MKVENPRALLLIGILIVGGIVFLSAGKSHVPSSPQADNASLSTGVKGDFPPAPELRGITGYINTDSEFTLDSVKGKVILVDFWTYSCINCIRTQPYLNAWHEKYADKGLVIVGVHAPEFDFEKKFENVLAAVEREEIKYPVVLDNDFATWRAYKNQYWPRKYLIDAEGFIRYNHIGEGAYEETEEKIRELLNERDSQLSLNETISTTISAGTTPTDFSQIRTPEIYLGYSFARAPLANPEGLVPESEVTYTIPETVAPNIVALEGKWVARNDYSELASEKGAVRLTYSAKNVNIVASGNATLTPAINGVTLPPIVTSDEKLYSIVSGDAYETNTLTLTIEGKGFKLYTFTFG